MGKKSQTVKKRQCLHCGHHFDCSSKQLKRHARSCKQAGFLISNQQMVKQ